MILAHSPFFVISLPRSRSAWLASFLSYKGLKCGHDLLVDCGSVAEFENAMAGVAGSCETAAVVGWKLLRSKWPMSKIVVITRDIPAIVASCVAQGLNVDVGQFIERREMLDMLSASQGVRTFEFEELRDPQVCKAIFEWLLEREFDAEWWANLSAKNIQIDLVSRVRAIQNNNERLSALTTEVLAATRQLGGAQCLGLQ